MVQQQLLLQDVNVAGLFAIEERKDDRGLPVFFVTRDGVDLTSRWTLEDADLALVQLRDQEPKLAA